MTTYDDLPGKVAVVTGAAGGMGVAISMALAKAGMQVFASDRLEVAPEAFRDSPAILYRQTDVTSEQSVAAMVAATLARYGQLDCAINAAAIEFELARITDCETDDFDRLMKVNLRGLFLCMKHQLRAMLEQESPGAMVNIVSTTAFKPEPQQPSYGASKHAVLGLTRQAAIDYAADGIRINGIAPGNIDTPMLRGALERRGIDPERAERAMPFKRFGNTREIAEAALWLCSEASSFTTGHVLAVEGGMLLG